MKESKRQELVLEIARLMLVHQHSKPAPEDQEIMARALKVIMPLIR